jgi:hypothetical protein
MKTVRISFSLTLILRQGNGYKKHAQSDNTTQGSHGVFSSLWRFDNILTPRENFGDQASSVLPSTMFFVDEKQGRSTR